MRFIRAIARKPGQIMVNNLTGGGLGLPDCEKAFAQNAAYIAALIECGLQIIAEKETSGL